MHLQPATKKDLQTIWKIILEAIEQRKKEGSNQWQDGYPNLQTIEDDIQSKSGYLLIDNDKIIAYLAIKYFEAAYEKLEEKWLTNGKYIVVHRVAVSKKMKKRGIASQLFGMIEDFAIEKNIFSIKVDTNFDNVPMLRILDKSGYKYCGEVEYRGAPRKAFEKVLEK